MYEDKKSSEEKYGGYEDYVSKGRVAYQEVRKTITEPIDPPKRFVEVFTTCSRGVRTQGK